jgi:DNA-directed RNA polymerase sigma subunit (sigma70/sigma32)
MFSKEEDEHTVEYWFNKAQESYKGKMYGETVFAVTEALQIKPSRIKKLVETLSSQLKLDTRVKKKDDDELSLNDLLVTEQDQKKVYFDECRNLNQQG